MVAPPEVLRNPERAQSEGRAKEECPKSAAEDSIEARVLHLALLQRSEGVLSFAGIATTLLQERLPWVTMLLYPTASEREECMLAMLFWVLAALAVVGALAIDWGLYLLARRWL
jgi:hypothetical protein